MHRLLGVSALIAVAVASVQSAPQAVASRGCLRWSDVETLTRTGPDTVRATTRRHGNFVIKFKGRCDFQRGPDNYFIVRLHDRHECVESLGAIEVHNAGACFIDTVTPEKAN
jgi:hypothetical protein